MRRLVRYIILLLILISFGCNETKESYDLGLDYFPIDTGNYIIYQVDSSVYLPTSDSIIHYSYKVKNEYIDFFEDANGQKSLRCYRYVLTEDDSVWQFNYAYYITQNNQFSTENILDIKKIKLVYPISYNTNWDCNIFNTSSSYNCIYDDINFNKNVLDQDYNSVISIEIENLVSIINEDVEYEYYARGIGLIEKESTHLYSGGTSGITSGYKLNYYITEYKN